MANCGFTVEPREIEVAQFEQNCLMLLDEIAATRQPLVITKGRKRLVKRIPVDDESSSSYGALSGTTTAIDDLTSPVKDARQADERTRSPD